MMKSPVKQIKTKPQEHSALNNDVVSQEKLRMQLACFTMDADVHTNTVVEFEAMVSILSRYYTFKAKDTLKFRMICARWSELQRSIMWDENMKDIRRNSKKEYLSPSFSCDSELFSKAFTDQLFIVSSEAQVCLINMYQWLNTAFEARKLTKEDIITLSWHADAISDKHICGTNLKKVMLNNGFTWTVSN